MLATSFGLPITDPVMIFALAMLVFVSVPLFFERLRVPGIIGLIVAGAAIGPNGLALLERNETIVLLGTVGLLYLMFMAGIEIDLHGFKKYRNRSLAFGGITFLLPQLLGTGVGLALGYGIASSILLASMFASHTLVAYPIASRLGIAKNEAVTTTVGGTIITDSAALLVLAVIASSVEGELNAAFWLR
ncbi:MAG TPA: cation:proton antiporter, partial [Longimicrobiaceae bacterium]|nr:cation:proton antiporter [Longimicrobiaceae bacterium]